MIVEVILARGDVVLVEQDDFSSLKVVARGTPDLDCLLRLLEGRPGDDGDVFVQADSVQRWGGETDEGWRRAFQEMLNQVEPFGWYDPKHGHIRMHVEWVAP